MKEKSLRTDLLGWIPTVLWGWFLLDSWTSIPVPQFVIFNYALAAFAILGVQILLYCNIKQIVSLRDKEMNVVFIIALITIVCMILSDSRPGAFFTVINFCLLLYVSDKWKWSSEQMLFIGIVFLIIIVNWAIRPIVADPNKDSNMAGTIMVFSTFSLISLIENYTKRIKWIGQGMGFLLLILCLRQLFIFHGRGSLLALIFYCILRFAIPKLWWQREWWILLLSYSLTVGSIIFVFVYTILWRKVGDTNQITIWRKEIFSGREVIWDEFITRFLRQPLWGTGSNFIPTNYFEFNVHNAMFDILAVHGIFVFVLVVFYFIKKIKILHRKNLKNSLLIPVFAGVMAVLLESITDMDLLWAPQFLVWSFILVVLNSTAADTRN